MNKSILTVIAGAAMLTTQALFAQDGEDAQSAKMKAYAEMGAGVQMPKTEKVNGKNVFKHCIIVGEARFSTALGVGKGLSVARRNAKLKAEAEFVSWMKTHVSAVRSNGDETVMELSGKDGELESETGTSTETSSEQITSAAQGAIRGMQKIGEWRDSENKMLYVIYAWKPDFAEMAAEVERGMEPPQPSQKQSAEKTQVRKEEAEDDKKAPFREKVLVAPGAEEFL